MEIAVFIFDDMTTLDAVGPLEVIGRLPGARVKIVSKRKGEVRAGGQGSPSLGLVADHTFDEVPSPDMVIIPGGMGTRSMVKDETVLAWVRRVHQSTKWTTSVCTGSLVLGAAGLLKGLRATTHWSAMDLLAKYGAVPSSERVIVEGKIVTSAGVSSGIDMALQLAALIAGENVARAIQLQIEYDPQPPFDSGSVDKASAEVLRLAAELARGMAKTA